jgi:hypothetical protein
VQETPGLSTPSLVLVCEIVGKMFFIFFYQKFLLKVLFVYDEFNWQINDELLKTEKMRFRRIEYELFDYPGSGANDRHSP